MEHRKILADIRSGLISRDMLDPDWERALSTEIEALKGCLHDIEFAIESLPDTSELIPCKLYLRLHFVVGLTMTQTAEEMNISASTLRRIRDRTARYFDEFPPHVAQK